MSSQPFRFVHASDFHLERTLEGVAEVPEHLRELFLDSPYWAAERVFETTVAEEAQFLILAGDVLDPRAAGPRGPIFLVEQFEKLAERDIPVYWATGRIDTADAWPGSMQLPDNVHLFPRGMLEEFLHQRDGTPLVRVIGASQDPARKFKPVDFEADPGGLFTVGVVHGKARASSLKSRGLSYWALGGRHERSTLFSSPQVAHYPGSPQGRSPDEQGKHGCTLVQTVAEGPARTSPARTSPARTSPARTSLVPTDVIRWLDERVTVDADTSREDLEGNLREKMHALIETNPSVDLLVRWTLAGDGPLLARIRRERMADDLLEMLRSEYGTGPPAAWSLSLSVENAESLSADLYEKETICGDFLRAIRQFQVNPDLPLELEDYVAEEHLAGTLGTAVALGDPATREQVLREVALLGVDLLGEEVAS